MHHTRRGFLGIAGGATIAAVLPKTVAGEKTGPLPELAFVQLTDTHIPDSSGMERSKLVVDAISELSLDYELVVHTGDVSNGRGKGSDMALARKMLKFAKPTYFVPGNHDVTFGHSELYQGVFEKHLGPYYHSITPVEGLRLAFFNSQAISDQSSEGQRARAFKELERILDPPLPTILSCHATGMPDFYRNQMHPGWPHETMSRWLRIMQDGGVFAILAGHFHRDEMHRLGNIPVHIAGPVSGWWGRQSSFRHWVVKDDRLTYRTVYI